MTDAPDNRGFPVPIPAKIAEHIANNPHRATFGQMDVDGVFRPFKAVANVQDMTRGIAALCARTHAASLNAGWYHDPVTREPIERNIGEMLMLMVSEIGEAMEGVRKRLMDDHLPDRLSIEVELADLMIRAGDLAGYLQLDLAGAIVAKMTYNAKRADHKLEARAGENGKAF